MTVLFDCPLWFSERNDPALLVSFMTGLSKPAHTLLAQMLCRRSLARQFPTLVERYGAHLDVSTLYRQLANHVQLRGIKLYEWLQIVSFAAKVDIGIDTQEDGLYESADAVDWMLCTQPNRLAALRYWFHQYSRKLFKTPVDLAPSVLESFLQQLSVSYEKCEEEARGVRDTWLVTRRCVAELSERVEVIALRAGTYTQEHLDAENQCNARYTAVSRCMAEARGKWGRLDYFRTESIRISES